MASAPVSVVIPTFNSAPLVLQAVESVLAQTAVPVEILVVDDGSVDDTRRQLKRHSGAIRYLFQSNQGVSAARNLGVHFASQPFVAFLDADDIWHPRKVELQLQVFDRHPDLGLVGTRSFDWPSNRFPDLGSAPRINLVSWSQLVVRNHFVTSSILVRQAALEQAGPFDAALQGPEDRDLWLRIAERTTLANLELPLTGYRDVPGSVSKQVVRCLQGMLRILDKLDQRGAWRGRWLLRRKAYSYVYHSCSYLFGAADRLPEALACSLKSMLWYPLPYSRSDVSVMGERPRRIAVHLLRWLGLKSPDTPSPVGLPSAELDALQQLANDRTRLGVGHE